MALTKSSVTTSSVTDKMDDIKKFGYLKKLKVIPLFFNRFCSKISHIKR